MAKAKGKSEITSVKGPYWDKADARWVLRWSEDGKRRTRGNVKRPPLDALKIELVGHPGALGLKPLRRFGGSATEFKAALASSVLAMNAAAISGDAAQLETLRKYNRGLAEAASAIVPHSGYIELEQEHAKLVSFVEDLYAARAALENATKSSILITPVETIQGGEEPDPEIPGSGGSLPN